MRIMMRDYVFLAVLFSLLVAVGLVFSGGLAGEESGMVPSQADPLPARTGAGSTANATQTKPEQQAQESREELRRSLQMTSGIIEQRKHDLPEMLKTKKIRILTTYSFSNYFIYKGQSYGYEHSKMEEFRKFLTQGQSRGELQVDFFYLPLPYDMLIEALNLGYGDIVAANLTITPERNQEVEFTEPYLWGIKEILISRKDGEKVRKKEDLSGKRVHVRGGSSYDISLQKLNKEFEAKGLKSVQVETLPGVINTGEIIEMLNTGLIDFTVADSHYASLAKELFPNIEVHEDVIFNPDVRFGWMVRKNNPELKASLNQFVATVKKGTLLGNIFYKRYFKDNPWLQDALKGTDLDRLEQYAQLFKKYGDVYDLDWLLLAAQSFQESRFDPNARSRTGATGLMQLMPSTGKDMGFNDIASPENNVHAGAKYLRWVMDRYFPDESISRDDRMRFALAAYNAGPANIRRSRSLTTNMGYDASKWFNHTEIGTMRQISLEPVHYVRNINKYYLSFKISHAVREAKAPTLRKKRNDPR
jgi:membrane-bound lytic murein transglycosylase MltF